MITKLARVNLLPRQLPNQRTWLSVLARPLPSKGNPVARRTSKHSGSAKLPNEPKAPVIVTKRRLK